MHRGAISDIRSKLFEWKSVEKVQIKRKVKKKAALPVPKKPYNETKDLLVEEIITHSKESLKKITINQIQANPN